MSLSLNPNDLNQLICAGGIVFCANGSNLNTSAAREAFIFQAPPANDTLVELAVWIQSTLGLVNNIGLWSLYAVNPNTMLPTGSPLASNVFTPVASTWMSFSMSVSTSGGAFYALVLLNIDIAPSSNYYRVGQMWDLGGTSHRATTGFFGLRSADGGSTWSTLKMQNAVGGRWSSAGWYTYPLSSTISTNSGVLLYNHSASNRVARSANKWVFPVSVRLYTLSSPLQRVGNPTFNVKGEVIHSSGTVVASSMNVVSLAAENDGPYLFPGVVLEAGETYYLGVTPVDATAGDASNYGRPRVADQVYAGDYALGPMKRGAYSTSVTPSWTAEPPLAQVVYVQPVGSAGGGGGSFGVSAARLVNGG